MPSESHSLRLTPADLPPVVEPAGLQPGLPPQWRELGRLRERPMFAELWPVFDDWRKRVTATPGNVPAVFCISGRSGEGKSALLLQLAAALLRNQVVPALRLWEASDDPRRFDILPVTDEPWQLVDRLPELIHGAKGEAWLRSFRERQPPGFIVTTASPTALEWFAKKYPKKFALTVWPLPPLSAEEAGAIATTAGLAAEAKLWCEGMTLETFLFAAKNGAALMERLDSLAIESLPVVGAANLLGLAVPLSLLKPEKQSLAQQLADQGRVPFRQSADGLRLVTPGLAQPLFDHWFPDVATRVEKVAAGFAQLLEIWLNENKAVAASLFLRRLLHSEHLARLLPPRCHVLALRNLRKNLCRELYRQHRNYHDQLPAVGLLSVWLEIGQTFRLRPDVMEDAANLQEMALETVTPALTTDIWLHSEYRKNPLGTRLRQGAAIYFHGTKMDAGAALARLYTETGQREAALPILQRWLETHPFHPHFGAALGAVLANPHGRGRVQSWALECLGFYWRGKAAGKALATLLQHQPDSEPLRKRTRHWLGQNAIYPEAGTVLAALLADGKGEKPEVGEALLWATHFPVHPVASDLWELLLKHHAGQTEVREVAIEWLKACPQHPQAATMLLTIARKEKNNPAFATVVQGWLATQSAHEQTPVLLETLASSTDEPIRQLLAQWLDNNGQHPAAARLLAAVLCAGKISPDWRQRAETFLQGSHPDALRVLRVLLGTSANDNVLKLVWNYLPQMPLPEQKKLARALGKLAGQQPERVAALRQGLPDQPELAAEFFHALRETLWELPMVPLHDWMKRGFAKLSEADQQWLFQRLLEHATPLPTPFSFALAEWLQRNLKRPAYKAMVQTLRQHPKQGRYFHAASMLPLNILADLAG